MAEDSDEVEINYLAFSNIDNWIADREETVYLKDKAERNRKIYDYNETDSQTDESFFSAVKRKPSSPVPNREELVSRPVEMIT